MATVATCFATVLLQPAHLAVDDIKVERKDISLLRELIMNYAALFTTNQQLQFIERCPHRFIHFSHSSHSLHIHFLSGLTISETATCLFVTQRSPRSSRSW